jgi:hypothetical protein
MIRRTVNSVVIALCAMFAVNTAFTEEPAPKPADGPVPHIKFDALDINLGDVVHGQDAVATFTYHNTGTAPLHILSAKPG